MNDFADQITITHTPRGEENGGGGTYVARIAGESVTGYLEWEAQGEGVRVATHTVVPRAIGGRGIAAMLVERLIVDARAEGFAIVPQCSYVARKFADNPDWAELRA